MSFTPETYLLPRNMAPTPVTPLLALCISLLAKCSIRPSAISHPHSCSCPKSPSSTLKPTPVFPIDWL